MDAELAGRGEAAAAALIQRGADRLRVEKGVGGADVEVRRTGPERRKPKAPALNDTPVIRRAGKGSKQ